MGHRACKHTYAHATASAVTQMLALTRSDAGASHAHADAPTQSGLTSSIVLDSNLYIHGAIGYRVLAYIKECMHRNKCIYTHTRVYSILAPSTAL